MKRNVVASRIRLVAAGLSFALTALLLASSSRAAEVTANISGTVSDSSGAVVPNANVPLTNTATNESRSVATESAGSYQFTKLPIGTYRLTIEQTGFNKYVREGIVLNVNQNAKLDVALKIGGGKRRDGAQDFGFAAGRG
jgi:type 1 fimbria pilin